MPSALARELIEFAAEKAYQLFEFERSYLRGCQSLSLWERRFDDRFEREIVRFLKQSPFFDLPQHWAGVC